MQVIKQKETLSRKNMKEVIATVQDIKYARSLAGNDKKIRDKAIKSLKTWFEQRCKSTLPFTENDLMLIWKGLFYSMWMSDKPLIQEECAERIANLIHSLDKRTAILFFKSGLKTLANEWFGIDQWRYDKFLMLVRRLLRQTFFYLKNHEFNIKLIRQFDLCLGDTLLSIQAPISLVMHLADIYMPELAKVTDGELNANIINAFIMPFVSFLAKSNDMRLINAIVENVFRYLIRQSKAGLEFEEKFEAWKEMGFPGGNIASVQRVADNESADDSDVEEDVHDESDMSEGEELTNELEDKHEGTALDPRAGRVDVILPQLNFSSKLMTKLLSENKFNSKNTKARGVMNKLIDEFTELAGGQYPLGIKKVQLNEKNGKSTGIKQSTSRLVSFKQHLYDKDMEQNNKRKLITEDEQELNQEVPSKKKTKLNEENASKKQQKKKDDKVELLNGHKKSNNSKKTVKESKEKINTKDQVLTEAEEKLLGVQAGKEFVKVKRLDIQNKLLNKSKMLEKQKQHSVNGKDANHVFVRNSGTWLVYEPETDSGDDMDSSVNEIKSPSPIKKGNKNSPQHGNSSSTVQFVVQDNNIAATELPVLNSPKQNKKSPKSQEHVESSTPKKALQTKALFPATEWDNELKDGEFEIFIPNKKYLEKRKSIGASTELVDKSFAMIKGKGRRKSLDTNVALNLYSTPKNKKVKIDLRLNKSQEIHEHEAQIKSSPGIPFDANKKPPKGVIKPSAVSSPINPFYKRLLLKSNVK